MEKIENLLSTAFAALCTVSVSGPAVVPMGQALGAVNDALAEVRRLRGEMAAPAEKELAE